ncbi:MAG: hypothetical protein U0R19_20085 [Bryobacteraceae bacterium]
MLASAFPAYLRNDALAVLSILPPPSHSAEPFSVQIRGEALQIPYRIYHDVSHIETTRLSPLQCEMLDCLLTRHHDGFVRQRHLERILPLNHEWVPPFVVQLAGEYVVEILERILANLAHLDARTYRSFLNENPQFFAKTKQRMISYWDCYYRRLDPRWSLHEYPGFRIVAFLENLTRN